MTKAVSTKELKLQRGNGATPEVFVNIAEVTNLTFPPEKADQIEVTSFDSLGKEYIVGLSDGGEVSFDCNFIGSDLQQQRLRDDLRAGTLRHFRIIVPDHPTLPSTVDFDALVTMAPGISGAVNSAVKTSGALKVSGLPIWTYAP